MEVRAAARAVRERLGHEGADHAVLAGDLAHRHLHQREVVGGGQRVGIGVVHLELAVRVLVVDLVDVDAGGAQRARELRPGSRWRATGPCSRSRAFRVCRVASKGLSAPSASRRQQHELRFDAGVEREALCGQSCELALQHHARAVGPGRAFHGAIADDARMAGHPRQRAQGSEVAHCHVVRAMRAHAETPQREAGEAGAIAEHHVQMLDGHGLGLGGAVDVDELRQHIADVLGAQSGLELFAVHRDPRMVFRHSCR